MLGPAAASGGPVGDDLTIATFDSAFWARGHRRHLLSRSRRFRLICGRGSAPRSASDASIWQPRGTLSRSGAGGALVAMGMYVRDGLARCQSVATLPAYRRRGFCSTLLHDACEHALGLMRATDIVLMTDPQNPAARVYESVGFRVEERVASLSISSRSR